VRAGRWVAVCCVILGLVGTAVAAREGLPDGTAIFLSGADGRLYTVRVDPVAGWPILFPVGFQASGPITGLAAGPDHAVYACDPCGGKILRVSVPDLAVDVVYDSHAQPACVCTEEVCDPYAGWLNPLAVTVAPDGVLYFITAGKKCVLTGGESQGLWRVAPGDPDARPEEVLPGALFGGAGPLSLAIVQTGSLSGRMLVTGLRTADDAVSVFAPPTFDVPSPVPGGAGAVSNSLQLLPDGGVLWLGADKRVLSRTDAATGEARELAAVSPGAVAFTRDAAGNLYVLVHSASESRFVILDPTGRTTYQQTLPFVPEAIGVLELP
jgi:hypothetical protein